MRLAVSRGWRDWPGEHHWNVSWVPAYTTADFCVCTTVHALPPAASDLLKKKGRGRRIHNVSHPERLGLQVKL